MKTLKNTTLKLTLLAIFLAFTLMSCNKFGIRGKGSIVEQEISISDFSGVDLKGSFNIEIREGAEQSVIAIGHENIIERLKTNVNNGVWDVELENDIYRKLDLTIIITSPKIDRIYLSGSGEIKTEGFSNLTDLIAKVSGSGDIIGSGSFAVSEKVTTKISGSGKIEIDFQSKSHAALISGSGKMELGGYTESQEISISGSGKLYAFDLNTETANVSISGSGDVEVFVNNNLDVYIGGSGSVYYKGNPSISQNIFGSGSVKNAN